MLTLVTAEKPKRSPRARKPTTTELTPSELLAKIWALPYDGYLSLGAAVRDVLTDWEGRHLLMKPVLFAMQPFSVFPGTIGNSVRFRGL